MKKVELLAPAGDLDKLKVAFNYGADAVYIGLKSFSLRANSGNFSDDEYIEGLEYAHNLNKKLYIALNIYFTPEQSEELIERLNFLNINRPDGLIVSDLGTIYLIKKTAPEIPIHISTQANTTNGYSAQFYLEAGATRIVLARELSLKQIKAVKDICNIELEAFVHGAMCIAYSGRCLLSSYMTSTSLGSRNTMPDPYPRSANKGDCSHSCRWEYTIKETQRHDQEFPIEEDKYGSYVLSSKDICMIEHIPSMIEAGIDSLKIEGRMKSILYTSSIVRAYRDAIDAYYENRPFDRSFIENELNVVSHREFSTGFFFDNPINNPQLTAGGIYSREMRLVGMITKDYDKYHGIKIYNKISENDNLEIISKGTITAPIGRIVFFDKEGKQYHEARHCDERFCIIYDINGKPIELNEYDIIRSYTKF